MEKVVDDEFEKHHPNAALDHEEEKEEEEEEESSSCSWRRTWKKLSIWTSPLMNTTMLFFIFGSLFFGTFIFSHFNNYTSFLEYYRLKPTTPEYEITYSPSINCAKGGGSKKSRRACPANYISSKKSNGTWYEIPSNVTCPNYFSWIHEDLRHWKKTGITKEMIEQAREKANFRVIILGGKLYVERYSKAFQSRDVFTIWGFVQLLRWYPGRIPDLDLMFNCDDPPLVRSMDYEKTTSSYSFSFSFSSSSSGPPPLFKYCSHKDNLDIVFPDWSFWGWAEVNIKPWKSLINEIKQGNKKTKWKNRFPIAYWKGNSFVANTRGDLFNCNISSLNNSDVIVYQQEWDKESKQGFKESNLADQCIHRYKIYIEGRAWSVSEKYIMACDSPTLYVDSSYYEFFSRSMIPLEHYWPINSEDKCKSLKFAVEWGNNHSSKAKEIGKKGSSYVMDKVKMEYVYDYMYHLLNEYAKLLKFKPEVSINATEICPESMTCTEGGVWKEFMMESWESSPSERPPCSLPPPLKAEEIEALDRKKESSIQQVESWKNSYWKNRAW